MEEIFNLDVEQMSERFSELLVTFGTSFLVAIIVLIAGLWLINRIVKLLDRMFEKSSVDNSLRPFLRNIIGITLKVILVITVIGLVGIETTSFIALIGSAGLAIGLALQGSLANFAGGILLLTVKPFKVGDVITAEDASGTVRSINILNTTLVTPQNQVVFIPNGKLASNTITNFSMEDTRRLDLVFGISYEDDIHKAKGTLREIIYSEELILKDPEPVIGLDELGDSSVNFILKLWVPRTEYWNLLYALKERVKIRFDEEGISIPYPQRDVHLFQKSQ